MTLELYLAYSLACIAIVIVPGPTVTVIIANSLAHGARAGLLNVAGTQAGLLIYLAVLLAGLAWIVETMAVWFDWVRLAGAAYLIWLGLKLVFSIGPGVAEGSHRPEPPRGGFFLQGFLVILSNPKALLFFGAFIPQFVDPSGDYVFQVILLAVTFMVVATILDGGYALLAGGAARILSRNRIRWLERFSGSLLISAAVWLLWAGGRTAD